MKIEIVIECDDDIADVKTFLSVCREETIQMIKKADRDDDSGEIEHQDSNMYGSHSIKITF